MTQNLPCICTSNTILNGSTSRYNVRNSLFWVRSPVWPVANLIKTHRAWVKKWRLNPKVGTEKITWLILQYLGIKILDHEANLKLSRSYKAYYRCVCSYLQLNERLLNQTKDDATWPLTWSDDGLEDDDAASVTQNDTIIGCKWRVAIGSLSRLEDTSIKKKWLPKSVTCSRSHQQIIE